MPLRVLAISSEVVWGAVGNSAAVPGLMSLGIEAMSLPTVILSNHPGHGKPAGLRLPASDIAAMLASLESLGQLSACDGVMTGYFADPAQVEAAAATIAIMKSRDPRLKVLIDPVLGDDHTGLYVPEPVAIALADTLIPLADIITPNRFELAWLTGRAVNDVATAAEALRSLGAPEGVATSVPDTSPARLTTVYADSAVIAPEVTMKRAHVPHGTGDLFSGLYLGHRLRGAEGPTALTHAITDLEAVIGASAGLRALAFGDGLKLGRA